MLKKFLYKSSMFYTVRPPWWPFPTLVNQLDWIRARYDICGYMLRWIRVCYGECGYATIYAGTMHYFKFNFKPIKLKLVTLKHCAPYGNWLPLSKSVFKFSISSVVQKIRALQFNYGHFAKSQSRFAAGQVNAVLITISKSPC